MASLSNVDICNSALIQLGGLPILSFQDDTPDSNACRDLYPAARDAVLESATWNFATFLATLARLADPPAWGWAYRYSLTVEPYLLRVLGLEHQAKYEIAADRFEGRILLTNADTAHVRYIGRVEDLGHWNALAVEALTKYMAAELAPMVTGQATRKAALLEEFKALLGSAVDRDGHEGSPDVVRGNRTLVHARRGSWGWRRW